MMPLVSSDSSGTEYKERNCRYFSGVVTSNDLLKDFCSGVTEDVILLLSGVK